MNDVQHFHDLLDGLETGLPDRPDVAAVVTAGRRRHRRRLALGAGVAAAVVVLAVPAAVAGVRLAQPHPVAAADAGPAQPAVAGFGDAMRAAVADAVPDATYGDETLADGFTATSADGRTVYQWSVQSPPHWSSLFEWQQEYALPGDASLEVTSSRMPPTTTGVGPDFQRCGPVGSVVSCESSDVAGGRLLVRDGLQLDEPDVWYREVSLADLTGTRGMLASVRVSASVIASSWAEARDALPPVAELTDLAQDPALVLPAPEEYPELPPQ